METIFHELIRLTRNAGKWLVDEESRFSNKELAYAVILVDMALVDLNFQSDEYRYVMTNLREHLGITAEEASTLINQAKKIVLGGGDLDAYAKFISSNLGAEQREELVRTLDQLLKIDSESHPFERQLRDRYEKMLGIGKHRIGKHQSPC